MRGLTLWGKHMSQYTDDVSQNCTLENYTLPNITLMSLIFFKMRLNSPSLLKMGEKSFSLSFAFRAFSLKHFKYIYLN